MPLIVTPSLHLECGFYFPVWIGVYFGFLAQNLKPPLFKLLIFSCLHIASGFGFVVWCC